MEYLYGQDCGSYTTVLEDQAGADLSAFMTVDARSGAGGRFNYPYSQGIRVSTSDHTLVGRYNIDIVIKQDPANGDGFTDRAGNAKIMPEVRYPLVVTVNPCVITSFTPTAAPYDVTYTLGDPAFIIPYLLDQTPDFCYVETVELTISTFVFLTTPITTSN